jgi:hypothetical protein
MKASGYVTRFFLAFSNFNFNFNKSALHFSTSQMSIYQAVKPSKFGPNFSKKGEQKWL